MIRLRLLLARLVLASTPLLSGAIARAEEAPAPASASTSARETRPMRDAVRNDELSRALRMAQQNDPMRKLGPATGDTEKDPSLALAGRDLVKDSIVLCFRGELTLVPKRSVLHLPPHLESRFQPAKKAAVKTWQEFYRNNRGWIRTVEVSREQAMGEAPFPEEIAATFETSNSVVVATFKGGPISVKPHVPPDPAAKAAGASAPPATSN